MRNKEFATRNFSILNMKDDYEEAFEILLKAMTQQNPSIDADSFDFKLRQVISSIGNNNQYGNDVFASIANEQPVQTIYSASGDLISMAYEAHLSGDTKQVMDIIESAFGEKDVETLIDAIQINNKRSVIGVQSDESDDSGDSDSKPDDSDDSDEDEDNAEIVDIPDDDDDQSDGLENAKPDDSEVAIVKSRFLEALSDLDSPSEDKSDKAEKPDENKDENKDRVDPKKPMQAPPAKPEGSNNTEVDASIVRAAANRLSLTGSSKAREKAQKLLSTVHKK